MSSSSLLRRVKSPATRWGRRCRWLVLALLVYTLAGFFLLPAIIRWQLVKRLPGLTHRQAAVQKVKFNPYALSLAIQGLALTETNGAAFAGFDEFFVNFQLSSLFHRAWTFREIRLAGLEATVVRDASGEFNFANLGKSTRAPKPEPAREPKPLPAVLVRDLVVTNGAVSFTDETRAKPLRMEVHPIDFDLKNLTTRPNEKSQYSLTMLTPSGGHFAWTGTVMASPLQSAGTFTLRGAHMTTYSSYLAEFTRAEIADGLLDVAAEYRLNAEKALQLEATNAAVKIERLQVTAPDAGETLLALNSVNVEGASLSLAGREARVPRVTVSGGSAVLRREKDGQLNWLKLRVAQANAPAKPEAPADAPEGTNAPWKAAVEEFSLDDFAVTVEDQVPPKPAQLGLDGLSVQVKGASNQSNAPVAATVEFKWRGGGTVRVEADGTLQPPAGAAKVVLTGLGLPSLQPYVEQQLRLVLNSGDLSLNGQARYAPGESGAPLVRFTGDLALAKFAATDTVAYHELAKWDDLTVKGIEFSLKTNALAVNEVKFQGLATSLVVSSNGQLNVSALVKKEPKTADTNAPGATAEEPKAATAAAFPIRVGTLVFEKCSFHAADETLTPRFNTRIEEFNGTIRDLTLPGVGKTGVDIRGKMSALAPFEVTGAITPDAKNPFVDLRLGLKNNDLTPFTPYSEKYVGHPLNRGKLSYDISYKVENRQLEATHAVVLEGLTFGARNESTNAPNLPIKLAVALLKDRNGRIDLDLPVSGSLDDPKFKIGALVWKALSNILLKVATSPFSLLGALVGGGGEEMQYVDFPAGAATLEEAQTNKLAKLTKALYERPALSIEISATVDAVADREALTRQKLQDKLKTARAEELTAQGQALPPMSELKLEASDYERLLRKAYGAAFPAKPESPPAQEDWAAAAAAIQPVTIAAVPPAARPAVEIEKGATRLARSSTDAAPAQAASPAAPATAGAPPPAPQPGAAATREEMEQRLMSTLTATDDDLQELMLKRTQTVQKHLLGSGKVTADRIFLTAPKPVPSGTNGLARVTFSLG